MGIRYIFIFNENINREKKSFEKELINKQQKVNLRFIKNKKNKKKKKNQTFFSTIKIRLLTSIICVIPHVG